MTQPGQKGPADRIVGRIFLCRLRFSRIGSVSDQFRTGNEMCHAVFIIAADDARGRRFDFINGVGYGI